MSILVMGEVALALALLVVGGLSVVDVRQLGETHPGFDAEGMVTYSLSLPRLRYTDGDERGAFLDEYLPRVQANPVVLNRVVSPRYFETARIDFAAGRAFDDFDGRDDGSLAVMTLVAMGVVAGLVISRAGATLVSGILVGVDALDPARALRGD